MKPLHWPEAENQGNGSRPLFIWFYVWLGKYFSRENCGRGSEVDWLAARSGKGMNLLLVGCHSGTFPTPFDGQGSAIVTPLTEVYNWTSEQSSCQSSGRRS